MNGRFSMVALGARSCAALVLLAGLVLLAACTSKTQPGPSSTVAPLVGCNNGATSSMVAESIGRRFPSGAPRPPYVRGRIAVRFSGTGEEPEVALALARAHAEVISPVTPSGYTILSIPDSSDPVTVAETLRATRGIAEAKALAARYPQQIIPDDPDFGLAVQLLSGPQTTPVQWDMYKIDMPDAWTISEGTQTMYIAIIDTGYDANNVDVCQKVVASAVFDLGGGAQDTQATAQDNEGHGTNVSGIAASTTDNLTRFAGVAWNVQLIEVRVFPQPSPGNPNPGATPQDIAAAIGWAVRQGAKVINLSVGNPGACDTDEGNAITAAIAAGVTVVAASGNTLPGSNMVDVPANCPGAIAVGASAINDFTNPSSPTEYVASYSNYGSQLALVAPGGDPDLAQQSCGPTPPSPPCDYLQWITNNYSTTALKFPGHSIFIAGTSQATPHVAGVAALMASKRPGIQPGQIKLILETSTDDVCGNCVQEGNGRLNAFKALTNT